MGDSDISSDEDADVAALRAILETGQLPEGYEAAAAAGEVVFKRAFFMRGCLFDCWLVRVWVCVRMCVCVVCVRVCVCVPVCVACVACARTYAKPVYLCTSPRTICSNTHNLPHLYSLASAQISCLMHLPRSSSSNSAPWGRSNLTSSPLRHALMALCTALSSCDHAALPMSVTNCRASSPNSHRCSCSAMVRCVEGLRQINQEKTLGRASKICCGVRDDDVYHQNITRSGEQAATSRQQD